MIRQTFEMSAALSFGIKEGLQPAFWPWVELNESRHSTMKPHPTKTSRSGYLKLRYAIRIKSMKEKEEVVVLTSAIIVNAGIEGDVVFGGLNSTQSLDCFCCRDTVFARVKDRQGLRAKELDGQKIRDLSKAYVAVNRSTLGGLNAVF